METTKHLPVTRSSLKKSHRSLGNQPLSSRQYRKAKRHESTNKAGQMRPSENTVEEDENDLRKLSSKNSRKFMEDFDQGSSAKNLQASKQRISKFRIRKNQIYSKHGLLLETSEDLCDCLEEDCPGCHFPCSKCSSSKCGQVCRSNRCWCYDTIEVQGTETVIRWPKQPAPLT